LTYENGDGKTKVVDSMKVEMAKQEATKTQPQKEVIVVNQAASASKKKMEQHCKGAVIE
jgi:hypothetical protein